MSTNIWRQGPAGTPWREVEEDTVDSLEVLAIIVLSLSVDGEAVTSFQTTDTNGDGSEFRYSTVKPRPWQEKVGDDLFFRSDENGDAQ